MLLSGCKSEMCSLSKAGIPRRGQRRKPPSGRGRSHGSGTFMALGTLTASLQPRPTGLVRGPGQHKSVHCSWWTMKCGAGCRGPGSHGLLLFMNRNEQESPHASARGFVVQGGALHSLSRDTDTITLSTALWLSRGCTQEMHLPHLGKGSRATGQGMQGCSIYRGP